MSKHPWRYAAQFSTVGLLLITILILFPPYSFAFVGDDYVQIDYILRFLDRPLSALQLFLPTSLPWYYRPLQNLWFLLNLILFGYAPFGYYWLGLLVHLFATAVLFRLTRQLGFRPAVGIACTALFAIFRSHSDVVAWISAIAIVMSGLFSLAAASAYLTYPRQQAAGAKGAWRYLPLTLIFFLLTLVSHEESILIPPLLLIWRLAAGAPSRKAWPRRLQVAIRRVSRQEWLLFFLMFSTTTVTIVIQLLRPNPTLAVPAVTSDLWLTHLLPAKWAVFTTETVRRFLPLPTFGGADLIEYSYIVTAVTGTLLVIWFWRSSRVARFGLLWGFLHLTFIYWALWSQKPTLYSGRHLYHAWIGLVVAIGATAEQMLSFVGNQRQTPAPRRLVSLAQRLIPLVLLSGLLLVLGTAVVRTRQIQSHWLARATKDIDGRDQLLRQLPQITEDTHLFAFRFPITPSFLRSVTQSWYNQLTRLSPPSGSLDALQAHGQATRNFYLWDYDENGRLYNLMPELQQADHTTFVWSRPVTVLRLAPDDSPLELLDGAQSLAVSGPADDRRLAIQMAFGETNGWISYRYLLAVPPGGSLQTAVRQTGHDGRAGVEMTYRIRLQTSGLPIVMLEETVPPGDISWHEVRIPLPDRETILVYLDVRGDGTAFWANPRVTR